MVAVTNDAVRYVEVAFVNQGRAVDAFLVGRGDVAVTTRTHVGHFFASRGKLGVVRVVAIRAHGGVVVARFQRLLVDAAHGFGPLFLMTPLAGGAGGLVEGVIEFAQSTFGIFGMGEAGDVGVTIRAGEFRLSMRGFGKLTAVYAEQDVFPTDGQEHVGLAVANQALFVGRLGSRGRQGRGRGGSGTR